MDEQFFRRTDMITLIAAWRLFKWIRKERRNFETNADAAFSDEHADDCRDGLVRIFKALEDGHDSEFEKLPKVIKWFFAHTKADNHFGRFGQRVLNSSRLSVYRTH